MDRNRVELFTGCTPGNPAHRWRAAHESEARESNSVCPAPKAGGSAISLAPETSVVATERVARPGFMLSTVEFSSCKTAGVPGHVYARVAEVEPATSGFGDRRSDLAEPHPQEKTVGGNENAARSGISRKGGVSRIRCVYVCRRAG